MIKNLRNLSLFTLICTTNLFAGINSTVSITGVASSTDVSGITSEINSQYQSSAQSQVVDFLNAMAAAQAMVNAGMGQDYSSNKSLFVVGGGANLGFNPGNNSLSNLSSALENAKGLPALGLGAQIGGFVGMSLSPFPVPTLGPIDLKRMTVFINYSGYNFDQVKPYTIKTSSFGIHAQYNAIQPVSKAFGILNWGGLNFGTGFDVSNNAFSASGSLTEAKYGSLNWKPTGTVSISNSAFVIPIEASTNVRLLYILSLIGGAGVDLMFSSSSLAASVTGPVSATVSGVTSTVGSATVTGTESGKGNAVGVRGFAGVALNLVPLKSTNLLSLVVLANAGTAGYGVKVGIQGAW